MIVVGINDFKKLIEGNYYYVDKTLLIKDLLDNKSEITLITRPRHFGKTINMSMLKYYFDNKETNNNLFSSLPISQYPEYKKYQEKYPVIFISLKDVKSNTWEQAYRKLQNISEFVFNTILLHLSIHIDYGLPYTFTGFRWN